MQDPDVLGVFVKLLLAFDEDDGQRCICQRQGFFLDGNCRWHWC